MRNKKNKEISWYQLNLAFAENARERRRVKRVWDRNLLNSNVVNTLYAIVLTTGIVFGTYLAYKHEVNALPSSIYKITGHKSDQTYLDDLLTVTHW